MGYGCAIGTIPVYSYFYSQHLYIQVSERQVIKQANFLKLKINSREGSLNMKSKDFTINQIVLNVIIIILLLH